MGNKTNYPNEPTTIPNVRRVQTHFMKYYFTFVITLLLVCSGMRTKAQVDINWLHNIKAGRYSQVMDFIHSDSSIYLSHCSKGAIENTEYSTVISEEDTQASLIKLDESGNIIWKNSIISKATRITNITKTNDGNIVAIGYSEGTATFISTNQTRIVNSIENCFLFVSLYSADGKLIDIKKIEQKEGRRTMYPTSVSCNSKGELYVSLHFYGALTHQGAIIENTGADKEYSAVLKFSKSGEFIETIKQWDLIGTRAQVDIKIDKEDNLIISGYSRGTVILSDEVKLECSEGDIYAANTSYSFVAKYSPTNELLWHQKIGGRNNQMITGLVLSSKNEIYLCGTYTFECIFSNIASTNNTIYKRRFDESIYYAKLQPEGSISFAKYFRSTGGNFCRSGSLAIDDNENVHMTGSYSGNLDFNSAASLQIGDILGDSYSIKSNWRVNTRGNSAWFYAIWKDDINIYAQNIYDLNGYPDAQYVSKLVAYDHTVLMGGFYHTGKPSLIASPENIELKASGDSGMYSVFVSSGIPELETPIYAKIEPIEIIAIEDSSLYASIYNTVLTDSISDQSAEIPVLSQVSKTTLLLPIAKVNIYPNPTTDYVNIKLNNIDGWVELMLVSTSGAIVHCQSIESTINGETMQLNLSSFASGRYYLVVSSNAFRKSFAVEKVR